MPPQPTGRLQGRIAIITGSSGGLGRAIAHLFASEGAKCFCVDKYANPRNPVNPETGKADDWNNRIEFEGKRGNAVSGKGSGGAEEEEDGKEGEEEEEEEEEEEAKGDFDINTSLLPTHLLLQQQFGHDAATFHAADLTSEPAVQSAITTCLTLHPRIDILINAHGISTESTHPTPLRCHSLPLSDFQLTQSINTTSLFLTCKHTLAQFLQQDRKYAGARGWIVNVASVQGLVPYYACAGYAASKGAVVMLTKQIALDYAVDGVLCNSVCPGYLDTNMTRNLKGVGGEVYRRVAERQPLRTVGGEGREEGEGGEGNGGGVNGGFGKVQDVARMVLVMAGDDVRWMTGQPVVVDGGYTIS